MLNVLRSYAAYFFHHDGLVVFRASRLDAFGVERQDCKTDETD